MKNREDAIALHEKSQQLYEKLSVLTFVDRYMNTTPNVSETKEELLENFAVTPSEAIEEDEEQSPEIVDKITNDVKKLVKEMKLEEILPVKEEKAKKVTFDEELKDTVSVDYRSTKIIAPNAFTPGVPGANGLFYLKDKNISGKYLLIIYNREGTEVYRTKKSGVAGGWDGTYKGKECQSGAFVWIAYNDDEVCAKGYVMLVK